MILDVRNKPIRTMLEGIRNKLMVKYSGTREKLEDARWEITPFYTEKLEEAKRWSRDCGAKNSEVGLWQITTTSGRTVGVDLNAKTCGCRKWDVTGIPCNHAVAAIMKLKRHPEDYVHEFFKKPMYMKAFQYTIYPVPGPEDWKKTESQDIDPPVFHARPGRKQVNKRKGQFEAPGPRDISRMTTITCRNCKLTGHKFSSCPTQLTPELQIRKNNHQPNRHNYEGSSTSGTASTSAAPTGSTTTPPAAARTAPVPPPAAARSAPLPPPAAAAPNAPRPFYAPRRTTDSEDGPSGLGKRKPKVTSRMQGYLNAGKYSSYRK